VNMMDTLEENAILYCSGDNNLFIPMYLQMVEGKRQDVYLVNDKIKKTQPTLPFRQAYSTDEEKLPGKILEHAGLLYRIVDASNASSVKDYWSLYNLRALDEDWSKKDIMTRNILATYHYHLGVDYYDRGEIQKAKEEFTKASLIAHDMHTVQIVLGGQYMRYGWLADAESAFKTALEIAPFEQMNAISHNSLGILYAQRGQYQDAEAEFQKALELDQDFADAYKNLGILNQYMLNDPNKAAEYWKRYYELNPSGT
jgi:tetratricopeptide (TPR) repeat protein